MADFQLVLSDTTRVIPFLMISSTDHTTGVTGLTPTVTLSKNGGAFGAATGTVAEVGNGNYKLTPSAADVGTLGSLVLHATGTGADPADVLCQVVAINIYDAVRIGQTALPNAIAGANGGLPLGDASGRTTVGAIAAGAITAAAVATDAIDADALATDAVTELQTGLATQALLTTVAGYVDTEVAAIKAKTDNLPASPAAVGSAMTLDLTQAVPTANTAQTIGDALNAARAQGFGRWVLSGTTLTLYAADGTTVVRTFTLDSATNPSSRT